MGLSVFLFSINDDDDRGTGEKEVKGQANARSPPDPIEEGYKRLPETEASGRVGSS